MKNNKNNSTNATFTKKWFYIAVIFGLIFATITTLIAIFRNVDKSTESSPKFLNEDFIKTEEKIPDIKKEESKNPNTDTNENKKTSQNLEDIPKKANNDNFIKPAEGKIITKHSNGELVNWKVTGDWRTHDGVDILAKKNTPVKAVSDGVITDIKNEDNTWGLCVTIDHKNGFKSVYKGLSEQIQVKLDQNVKSGEVIGTVGNSNKMESNLEEHLHFMLEKDGEWVNPTKYIKFSS